MRNILLLLKNKLGFYHSRILQILILAIYVETRPKNRKQEVKNSRPD